MFNKPDISKEGLERLNNMETMIDNNLMSLSIKNISNKENKKIENNDIQIDQNFIIENENKDDDIDQFYENMKDNLFEDKVVEKFNFIEEDKDNYENKKRFFNEAFINEDENNRINKKFKPN